MVMVILSVSAVLLAVIPVRFILMGMTTCGFMTNSKIWKFVQLERGNRRLKEWWDLIPVVPIRVVDKEENFPN
ncbi:hypothetical protein SAY86_000490 [Trapa natans]|uniref:Uncharacterized protein n=1 Tax=Trapa natans TaxID=22666 RepID=A0AAN7MC46_TRANT|nr:hypothetical protein SAY86_000490 [Trapa natans]